MYIYIRINDLTMPGGATTCLNKQIYRKPGRLCSILTLCFTAPCSQLMNFSKHADHNIWGLAYDFAYCLISTTVSTLRFRAAC